MNDIDTMELKIAKFLRFGVFASGAIILLGWIMSFRADADPFAPLKTYEHFSLIDSIQMNALLENWGRVITYMGLSMLISLPIIRVLLSIVLFVKQKEKTMALLGAIVLIGLVLSFSLGVEH